MKREAHRHVRAVVFLLGMLVNPTPGRACVADPPETFEPSTSPTPEDTPPEPVGDIEVEIVSDGFTPRPDDCSDVSIVRLRFAPPADDRTAPADLGYRVEHVDGPRPFKLNDLDAPMRAQLDGTEATLTFTWLSGGEPTARFRLTLQTLDSSGQAAWSSTPVDIEVPASDDGGGCRMDAAPTPAGVFGVLLLVGLRRRRRR